MNEAADSGDSGVDPELAHFEAVMLEPSDSGAERDGGMTGTERWCTEHTDPVTGAGHWHPTVGPLTPYGQALADARIEGYDRGHFVATSRARSRIELGLTV